MNKTDKFKKNDWYNFRRKVRKMEEITDNFQDIKDDGACYVGQPKDNLGIVTPQEEIKATMKELAEINGFELSDNVDKIINAKLRFFGLEEWQKCCCVRDDEHFCISTSCRNEIKQNGRCDCNLFKLPERKNENE